MKLTPAQPVWKNFSPSSMNGRQRPESRPLHHRCFDCPIIHAKNNKKSSRNSRCLPTRTLIHACGVRPFRRLPNNPQTHNPTTARPPQLLLTQIRPLPLPRPRAPAHLCSSSSIKVSIIMAAIIALAMKSPKASINTHIHTSNRNHKTLSSLSPLRPLGLPTMPQIPMLRAHHLSFDAHEHAKHVED